MEYFLLQGKRDNKEGLKEARMKKVWPVLFLLLLAYPALSQVNTGNIQGAVVDQDGNPLPGVTVTLTHGTLAPITVVTSAEGIFRFRALFPANDYVVRAELQGFKPQKQTDIIVTLGETVEIRLVMEQGKLEEQITVVAVSPIVQTKKTSITTTMNATALQSLPTARNPWVVLQMAPAVVVDREDIGGNESGQQSGFIARGGGSDQWNLDGVTITDPSSGGSPSYYDFDAFEEMTITSGGMDVETQTGGILINMVTKRATNRLSLGGRVYFTDQGFQSTPTVEKIRSKGITTTPGFNKIDNVKDYGVNVGGPILKDKVWLWGSIGVQDIKQFNLIGKGDDTLLSNLAGKLNFQIIPENRAEVFYHLGNKNKWGRDSSETYPPGTFQANITRFGSPLLKIQDEHMFSQNLFLTAKFSYQNSGFTLVAMDDREQRGVSHSSKALNGIVSINQTTNVRNGGGGTYYSRPMHTANVILTYYNDNLFGTSHEVKAGFDWAYRKSLSRSHYPGNMYVRYNYPGLTVDWDGNGTQDNVLKDFGIDLMRLYFQSDSFGFGGEKAYAGYLNDTISFGRFNVRLGIRYDRQMPFREKFTTYRVPLKSRDLQFMEYDYDVAKAKTTAGTLEKIAAIFPDKSAPAVKPDFKFELWSPRVGLTWDIFGNGKTMAKLNFANYGEYQGVWSSLWAYSGLGGTLEFYWHDANADGLVDFTELYWADTTKKNIPRYRAFDDAGNFVGNWANELNTFWSGWDANDPMAVIPPMTYTDIAPGADLQFKTQEVVASLEREIMTDFAVSVNFTYRKFYDQYSTFARYPDLGNYVRNSADYEIVGQVPATLTDSSGKTYSTGDAAGKDIWMLKVGPQTNPTSYYRYMQAPKDRYNKYWGLDFVFTKRYSNKWMASGSVTYQWQKAHYNLNYWGNPSDLWAYQNEPYNYSLGGASGKIGQPAYVLWMGKFQGMYSLPWDINVSVNFTARQGWVNPITFTLQNNNWPNSRSRSFEFPISKTSKRERLPVMAYGNVKVEKMLRLGDGGKIYLSADAFNVLDSLIANRQYARFYGVFYLHNNTYAQTSATQGLINEVLNPRIFRFGIRFEF
jgi:hypothetical protein